MTREQARIRYRERGFWTRVTEYRGSGYCTWAFGWDGFVKGCGRATTVAEAQSEIDHELDRLYPWNADG